MMTYMRAFTLAMFCAIGTNLCIAVEVTPDINCDLNWDPDAPMFNSGFTELRNLAIETNNQLCQSMLVIEGGAANQVRRSLLDFNAEARMLIYEAFPPESFTGIGAPFDYFESTLFELEGNLIDADLDRLSAGLDIETFGSEFYFNTMPSSSRVRFPPELDEQCLNVVGSSNRYESCQQALEDASVAFNAYRHSYDQYRFDQNRRELTTLRDEWKRFLDESRSQTLVDVWFTTLMHRNYYAQNRLVPPASTQYFLLHPHVVYEYVGDAPAGQRGKAALGAEWVGVNWWDLKVPLGVSLVSTWSDRADTPAVGHGLLLTVSNHYLFGWTMRDESHAFFLTVDFLKASQSAGRQLDRYKSMF
ncbi:MAG: hypothetical protein LAT65_00710 [Saccharospirillum sp.]|nr:hypothetical protein [Saccharospirillum sp.]